mgnify:FL=1
MIKLKNKPLIGIITISLGWVEDSYHIYFELEEELTELGVELVVFTPYGIDWMRDKIRGLVFKDGEWERGETRLPDAVYNRLYGTNPKTIARLVKELGTNHVYNHENRLDKSVVANLLARSKLKEYLPATYGYSWDNLKMLLDNQSRVVLKPVYGHYGLDIILIEQGENGWEVFVETLRSPRFRFDRLQGLRAWTEELNSQTKSGYLVQRWIEPLKYNGRYFDLRLLLQRGGRGAWETTAVMSRITRLNYFVSNFVYKTVDGEELLRQVGLPTLPRKLGSIAYQAAELLERRLGHFAELSVDFLVDNKNQPWIIEINGKPRRDLFEDYADEELLKKIYLRPIVYGRYLAAKKLKGQR